MRGSIAAAAIATLAFAPSVFATDYSLSPGMSQSQIQSIVAGLQPGDTLNIAAGTYDGNELDLQSAPDHGVAGTANAPIVIQGVADASGALPHFIAHTDDFQEAVRIRPGCAYITIANLHLSATGSTTQAGIFVDSGVHDITIRDNEIEHVTGIGIQMHSQSDIHDVLMEHNHIHDTGTNTGDGSNGGQGFQAGGFTPERATTGVFHLVFRHNLVHDIAGQEGDCIALLYGVYASTIEDNVTYNCPRGASGQTENYGIAVDGTDPSHYANGADNNIVRRNVVADTARDGHHNVGIYVGAGTTVENNIVLRSSQGIAARLELDSSLPMRNVRIVNNTVYDITNGTNDNAFSIRGCANADSSVVVTGNVFIAVNAGAFGYRMPDPLGQMVARANYFEGEDYAEAAPPIMNHLTEAPSALFAHPSSDLAGADFMPAAGSPLVDHADPMTAPGDDFDLATRPVGGGPDVGAYESGSNAMHAPLARDFKARFATGAIGGDGGVGTDPGTMHAGCGCRTVNSDAGRGWLGLVCVAMIAARRRRVRDAL